MIMADQDDYEYDDEGDDGEDTTMSHFISQIHRTAMSHGCVAVEAFTCQNPECGRRLIVYHGFHETIPCGYCGTKHASKSPSPGKQLKNSKIESAFDVVQALCPPATPQQTEMLESQPPAIRSIMQVYALDTANKLIRRLRTLMELDT